MNQPNRPLKVFAKASRKTLKFLSYAFRQPLLVSASGTFSVCTDAATKLLAMVVARLEAGGTLIAFEAGSVANIANVGVPSSNASRSPKRTVPALE